MSKIKSYTELCKYITDGLPISTISVDKNDLSFWNTDTVGYFPNLQRWLSLNPSKEVGQIHCSNWKDTFGFIKDVKNISSLFFTKLDNNIEFFDLNDIDRMRCFLLIMFNILPNAKRIVIENNYIYILEDDNVQIGYFINFLKLKNIENKTITFRKENMEKQLEVFGLGGSDNTRVIPIIQE